MRKYYLVARSKDNDIKIINFEDDNRSLEKIDLITSNFNSSDELIKELKDRGYIDRTDVDLFVVKKSNKSTLKYYEVIYNDPNSNLIRNLRTIAKSFLDPTNGNKQNLINEIISTLNRKYNRDSLFRKFVDDRMFKISNWIVEELGESYSGFSDRSVGWISGRYRTIRNIVEAINRYDQYGSYIYKKTFPSELSDSYSQEIIFGKINRKEETGQFSFFDEEHKKVISRPLEVIKEEVEDVVEQKNDKKEEVEETIIPMSNEEKKKEVLQTIRRLPRKLFSKVDDKIVVNNNLFELYPSEEDEKKFSSLLRGSLLNNIYLYVIHSSAKERNKKNGFFSSSLDKDIGIDYNSIKRNLENEKNLDKAYEWSQVYSRCKRFNDQLNNNSSDENKVSRFGK